MSTTRAEVRKRLLEACNSKDNLGMGEYELRSAAPSDEQELTELFACVFGKERSLEEWRWKFIASRDLVVDHVPADSLVALSEQGSIVAHAGAVTLPGWFYGQSTPFVQICDVMVHPAHRGGLGRNNLFTVLLRSLLSQIADLLPTSFRYGFPGRGPYLVGERARVYEAVEVALEAEIPAQRRFGNPWRAGMLPWDDPRLDRLWKGVRKDIPFGLVRNADYLRWRYAESPVHRYELVGVTHLGRLRGWAVVSLESAAQRIVDVLLPRVAVRRGLEAVASHVRPDTASLSTWLPRFWQESLGFPTSETPVVVALMRWRSTFDVGQVRRDIYYTMGDVDIF